MKFLFQFVAIVCLPILCRSAQFQQNDAFLKSSGGEIRDRAGAGDIVHLRGVNLGGWLVMEGWQTPMDAGNLKDDWSVRETLTKRFGESVKDSLMVNYEETWITEVDLDHIAAMGFNVIRLPFWYLNLQDEKGAWRPDAFQKLDWLVTNAWKRHIYTILDFHGVPGGQSDGDSTGRVRKKDETGVEPTFWKNEENLRRTADIWTSIARHFAGNPAVAAYDLINEPTGAPSRDVLWKVYDRLYHAIRAVDPDHMIAIEGCWGGQVNGKYMGWGLNVLPPPTHFGWTNVLYEIHAYEWAWNDLEKQRRNSEGVVSDIAAHASWKVPVFLGEFNCMGQAWDYSIDLYEKNNVSWAVWTYKATHGTGSDSWGVFNPKDPMPPKPDIAKDSAETIRAKWRHWSTKTEFAQNQKLARVLTMPVPTDDQYDAHRGFPLSIAAPGVLANDHSANPDAGKLTARKDSDPAHGTLTLKEDGSFTYLPRGNFPTVDSFRYSVSDGKHESVSAGVVSITVR